MSRTVIDTRGTIDFSSGEGLTVSVSASFDGTVEMDRMPYTVVSALTDPSGSMIFPGVYTAGHTAPSGYYLPAPSTVPGGVFTFRSTTAFAHWLTSSVDSFGKFMTDGTGAGSQLTIANTIGSSVTLISDGNKFCVMARSGSITFAGT